MEIALTSVIILGFIFLMFDREEYEIIHVLGMMITAFFLLIVTLFIWTFEDDKKENKFQGAKDYMNGKIKVEITYKKQQIISACGSKDTIDIPVDTILIENK